MERRIRVCQVLSNYVVGGAEMVALDVACHLDPDRFESMAVAVIDPCREPDQEMRTRFEDAGVPAHTLCHRSFRDPRTLWDMACFFRRHRPDIIHGHKRFSDLWACRVGRWSGVPHRIWTRHSVYRDMNAKQLGRYRSLEPHTPVILAVSDAVRRNCIDIEGMPADKVRTVVNGIDTRRFSPQPVEVRQAVRASLGVADTEHLLLFVGRLSAEKAPEAFPALVAMLRDAGLLVRGFVCGAGPLESRVRQSIGSAPVTMLGLRSDIPELLAAADLLVSTSRVEGLPLNIMEAMAGGTAFVGPDLDQVLQLVADEPDLAAGVYQRPPVGDTAIVPELLDRWADVIAARLEDAEGRRRAGVVARDIITKSFSLERMVQAHAQIYEDLVGGRLRPERQ